MVAGANPSLGEAVLHRVDEIETRWSRFRVRADRARPAS